MLSRRPALIALVLSLQLAPLPVLAAPPQGKAAPPVAPRSAASVDVLLGAAPFSLSPSVLLGLRGPKAPAGGDIEVLLDDTTHSIDAEGKRSAAYHMVYRVLSDAGVENWASLGARYHPWFQNRPELKARIITPEGGAHQLDPSTQVDALAEREDATMFNDARVVSAPLPAVRVGSVVETYLVVGEHRPFFAAGSLDRHALYVNAYTALTRVTVEASDAVRLSHSVRATASKPVVEKRAGKQRVSLLERDLLPLRKWPANSDPDQPFLPTLEFATGKSWNDIARSYAQAVDEKLAGFDASTLAADILAGERDPAKKLDKLLAYLHKEVRYTGLELGERALLPNAPADTLTRHYGDCKDKATLLVGLLRASGFEAHVALLRTGPGLDVPQKLAGLGLFDHAIVRVAGKQPLWIDATAEHAGPADLPYMDQDRWALVASSHTRGLERTPRTRATDSISSEVVHIQLSELGNATLREVSRGRGSLEAELRSSFDKSDEQLKEQFKSYAKDRYGAAVSTAHAEAAHDLTRRFELTIDTRDAENFETFDDGGFVNVHATGLYAQLPATLYATPKHERSKEEEEADAPDPRYKEPPELGVYLQRAHTVQVSYQLALADGFRFHTLPDPLEMQAEGIVVARKVRREDDRHAAVEFELRTDTRMVAPAALEQVRKVLTDFDEQSGAAIRYVHAAHEALDRGELEASLKVHRELIKKYPKSVPVQSRYVQDLLRAGLGVAARRSAEQLAKEHPQSARAQWTLGYVWLFDEAGRDSYPGSDFVKAEKALRTALARDPEDEHYYRALATVLSYLAIDKRPIDVPRLEEAAGLYETLRTRFKNHDSDLDLLRNYLWRDKHRELGQLAEELSVSEDRNGFWVASIARRDGASAAQRKAEQLSGGDPKALLLRAASWLGMMGRYDTALEVARLPLLRGRDSGVFRPLEAAAGRAQCEAKLPAAVRAVLDWHLPYFRDQARARRAREELEKLPEGSVDVDNLVKSLMGMQQQVLQRGRHAAALSLPLAGDAMACLFRWEAEERNNAVRVKAFLAGAASDVEPSVYYLRKNKKGYQLIGVREKGRTVGLGRAMLNALEQKQLDEARVWAEWAELEVKPYGGHKERYSFADAAKALWPRDLKLASAEELSMLGAMLSGGVDVKGRELKLLDAALKRAGGSPDRQRAINLARGFYLGRAQNYAALEPLLAALHREFPEDETVWQRYMYSLLENRKRAELLRELEAFDAKKPDNTYTADMRNRLDRRDGRFADVAARTQGRLDAHKATRNELNNVAWASLFASGHLEQGVKLAEAACEPASEADSSELHTLATLYAETGDVSRAQTKLVESMTKRGGHNINQHEWYTWGRIAERLGLAEVARDAYQRVEKPDVPGDTETYLLAQQRLKQLGR